MRARVDWLAERLDRMRVALDGLPKSLQIALLIANGAKAGKRRSTGCCQMTGSLTSRGDSPSAGGCWRH